MSKYHDLAIYHARIGLTAAADQLNLQIETARVASPFTFPGSELEKVGLDLAELYTDLLNVIDKWAERQEKKNFWQGIENLNELIISRVASGD